MRKKFKPNKLLQALRTAQVRPLMIGAICGSAAFLPISGFAQESTANDDQVEETTEVIEIQGVRQTIQTSNAIKRESTQIVDGLSAADIGDLPALSIGEALETLTGASSHREQGGATEISIRGLGPFLGSSVINGREASNGSGDRSVNFSQFPSELFNKIAIYKTQSAELIEGGVSGQIHLDTKRALDFGKRSFQLEAKGNWNPDNADLVDPTSEFGHRLTASFVDQYYTDSLGDIGFSVGYQKNVATNPEQEARTGTSYAACRVDPGFGDGINASRTDCEDFGGSLNLNADPATGAAPDANTPFIFSRSQNSFRQNITDDERESFFASLQWRPNNRLEINLDYQYSNRDFTESRNDFVLAEVNHIDGFNVSPENRLPVNLTATSSGALRSYTATQNLETNSQYAERLEDYEGGGVNFAYSVNDSLSFTVDLSTSTTSRRENIIQTRLQSEDTDIYGNDVIGADGNGEVRTAAQIMQNGSLLPTWTFQNFDVNYHGAFADEARTRLDVNQFRNNSIDAARIDFEYLPDSQTITAIKAGFRVSKLAYDSVPGAETGLTREQLTFSDEAAANANELCRNSAFPESGFLDNETGGAPLFTNVDENGNVISAGTGNSFATFDARCLAESLLSTLTVTDENGSEVPRTIANSFPTVEESDRQNIESVDVEENTLAAYIQADYDTFLGDYGVRGNFGLRVIRTEVSSTSFRGALQAVRNDLGNITDIVNIGDEVFAVEGGSDYTEFLPSVNLVVDVSDDILVRGAVYRGLSRPDPADLGFGRSFSGLEDDDETGEISELVATATAIGNPNLKPFLSWNADVAAEWYPNEDTVLALGLYYKSFDGGFENISQTETFEVDGEPITTIVTVPQTSDDKSTIYGLELTATHSLSYLDSWLNGFGIKLSYNYADSDFEFQDEDFGTSTVIEDDVLVNRVGIVTPANLFGFSEHVLSAQLYYQWEDLSMSLNYKYRSDYFQQFLNTPGAVRFVGDTEVFEAKVSYRLNRNWKFSASAINLFDDPKRQYRPTIDNFSEINVYGPRVFAGVQFRY